MAKTYGSSHEYYTFPSIEFSKLDTFLFHSSKETMSNSSLFIFMRFPSAEKYFELKDRWTKPFYSDFELVDEFGDQILNFDSRSGIEVNENHGWLAFNATLPHGIYYLIYHGSEPRQIPIYVFKNWHTQFFMTLGKSPLFGTTRIFISSKREFDPYSETNKYIDILLDKIQNRDFFIDKELISIAASGKYDSPMLGLICSYIYLKSPQNLKDDLFRTITQNMQRIVLKDNDEAPDLRALNILASQHFGNTNFDKKAVKGTPMLRMGFEAIRNASIKNNKLIPKRSVNDFISETLYYDSPYNTFKPIPFYKKPKSSSGSKKNRGDVPLVPDLKVDQSFGKKGADFHKGSKKKGITTEKYDVSVQDLFKPKLLNSMKEVAASNSENNWIRNSISGMLSQNENISINDISDQLSLSGNTVTRIFNDWKNELKGNGGGHNF